MSTPRLPILLLLLLGVQAAGSSSPPSAGAAGGAVRGCPRAACIYGRCVGSACVCDRGWVGDQCQHCAGRFKLTEPSGMITDGPNKYKYKTKCTWLIEGFPNAVLRLRFNHFATECSWDHMYVYDGDSIYSPLLAAFSGLIVPEARRNETVPEVVATSGFVFLHFFSDAAYNLTGFNISYSMNSCPNNCSGHGRCVAYGPQRRVTCQCERGWKGEACDFPYCNKDCGAPHRGHCERQHQRGCVCQPGWQGPDCSLEDPSEEAYWLMPDVTPPRPLPRRASHKAVVLGDYMWVVGGYTFNYTAFHMVTRYNLRKHMWDPLPDRKTGPSQRYGHSLASHQSGIYMYGGRVEASSGNVSSELWWLDVTTLAWTRLVPQVAPGPRRQQFAVVGHSAHIVPLSAGTSVMLVFFGHCPTHGYVNFVQEYNLNSGSWRILESSGARVQGMYGHSSAFDPSTHAIYIHGGYKAFSPNKYGLVDDLYKYNVDTRTWMVLKDSGFFRFLHSSVVIGGTVLLFGGNAHNDTSMSNGARCFSADFLAYDIASDEWTVLPKPNLHRDVNRFGHSAVVSNGSMYIFGGFNSLMLGDVLEYRPPGCGAQRNQHACLSTHPGVRCLWLQERCVSWEEGYASAPPEQLYRINHTRPSLDDERCDKYTDCASCTSNTNGCLWCDDQCISDSSNCTEGEAVMNLTECVPSTEEVCNKLTSCTTCLLESNCQWDAKEQECTTIAAHLCGERWMRVGAQCLRVLPEAVSNDDAKLQCYNEHAALASLTSQRHVDFLLASLRRDHPQLTPWVGLRKINVSYWSWDDMSPFANSSLQWLPREPSDSGFCAYLDQSTIAGLRAHPCTSKVFGAVCQKTLVHPTPSSLRCRPPCALRRTCGECTSSGSECMWCSNAKRCVESHAYVPSFPYGQCMEWNTANTCPPESCAGHRTCSRCLDEPGCGWCNDASRTGRGLCLEGSSRGPLRLGSAPGADSAVDPALCRADHGHEWAFIQCPPCQCNGHSNCVNGSLCESCQELTTGKHCETCMFGYYGDATNGGKCQECFCNGHATNCNPLTGKCFCTTKGIRGDQCEVCETENRYLGNSLKGTCYYNLMVDYQFTFSLSLEEDSHYTAINFKANPDENRDMDMFINASKSFNLNITWSSRSSESGEEVVVVSLFNIKEYEDSFSDEQYDFEDNPNITFYVYVSNFTAPISIQISFSQRSNFMDLVQFFVTFFSCFLSLLLLAAVVWKIKHSCWASHRREMLVREKQQMGSRPVASVSLVLPLREEPFLTFTEPFPMLPKPIALQPCTDNRATIVSIAIMLPHGLNNAPPPGQSGLAVGSALIDLLHQRAAEGREKAPAARSRKHQVL
ncbi:attractin-like protein 1 isoform X1 [Lethenteron reissneri]|uniref:attractin-like protein 1 isoform X1 n=1 Tax=Lethenteron reissneri TaxID=7753 RepID=UPI002AB7847E|nr:attractin-like protein 1 isoform X1 [Lethenteron reissneri]